jgi:uncharacterized membrane protein YbhN (UPF0104 family)
VIDRALRHPFRASFWTLAIALGSYIGLSLLARHGAFTVVMTRFNPWWLLLAVGTELASVGAYAYAYQRVVRTVAHRRLSARLSLGMVLMGFGTFAFFGGFALDRRGLQGAGVDPREAQRSVLGLGAIELLVLSAGAWIASVVLLAADSSVSLGMILPWTIGVPSTITVILGISHYGRRRGRMTPVERLASATESVTVGLLADPLAALGMAVYFTLDLVALDVCLWSFGASINLAALVIAYSSGFLFTRRTLPLGGAGVVEALLTFSVFWVGAPLAPTIVAVFAFRVLNLGMIGLLGLPARRLLLDSYGVEIKPTRRQRARAAAAAIVPAEPVLTEPPPAPGH